MPIREGEWAACLEELVRQHGLRTEIALCESGEIGSPLTLGLRRPVILLLCSGQDWTAEQRTLILRDELAHIRRGDFLTARSPRWRPAFTGSIPGGWLAGRLRLEQEFAADAWVASAVSDTETVLALLAAPPCHGPGNSFPCSGILATPSRDHAEDSHASRKPIPFPPSEPGRAGRALPCAGGLCPGRRPRLPSFRRSGESGRPESRGDEDKHRPVRRPASCRGPSATWDRTFSP